MKIRSISFLFYKRYRQFRPAGVRLGSPLPAYIDFFKAQARSKTPIRFDKAYRGSLLAKIRWSGER